MNSVKALFTFTFLSAGVFAQSVILPNTITVSAASTTGSSFTYNGTLTQAATINLTAAGAACEQSGGTYCTNASGVLTVAGSSAVGQTTTFTGSIGGFSGTFNYGSLIMTISGVGSKQLFAANATDGLGSGAPPSTLTLPATSLSALGFGNFSVTNPTITFTVADTLYTDNSGSFSVTSGNAAPSPTPAPGTIVLVIIGLAGLTGMYGMRLRARSV